MLVIVVFVGLWTTEGGDLDETPTQTHVGQAESPPNDPATRKNCFDFLRYRVCRYIVVLGHLAQQQVADAATNDISFITLFLKSPNNLAGVRAELLHRDPMLRDWNNNVLTNDKFPKTFNKLAVQTHTPVEQSDHGSLT